jgi:GntR family transcriptional regulator of vanillate catabolism
VSQATSVLLQLRGLILGGELSPGERLSENVVADRLGASRTPVRAALACLAGEGLLDPIPSGGFAVRSFTEAEIRDAIEVRGTLEGLAARFAAERAPSVALLARLRRIVDRLDIVCAEHPADAMDDYITLNGEFHQTLAEASGSLLVMRELRHLQALPFASPSAFLDPAQIGPDVNTMLQTAQDQHREVLELIVRHRGAEAEAVMRAHAQLAHRNLTRALRGNSTLRLVPHTVIHLRLCA